MRATALTAGGAGYQVGQQVEFLIGTPASRLSGFLPTGIIFNNADKPQLAATLAQVNSPAATFVKKLDVAIPLAVGFFTNKYVVWGTDPAASGSRAIQTSADGIGWVKKFTVNSGYTTGAFAAGPALAMVVGNTTQVFTSPDGETWTGRTAIPTMAVLGRLMFANGLFWAVGNTGTAAAIYSTADGVAWASRTIALTVTLNDIGWNGTMLATVGNTGKIATSSDGGATWVERASGVTENLRTIIWDGTKWVVTGMSGRLLTSVDGINWAKGVIDDGISMPNRMVYANGVYVLASTSGALDGRKRLMVGTTLNTMTSRKADNSEVPTSFGDIAVGGNRFISMTSGGTGYNAGIVMTDQPTLDPATQSYIPRSEPSSPLYATYVYAG